MRLALPAQALSTHPSIPFDMLRKRQVHLLDPRVVRIKQSGFWTLGRVCSPIHNPIHSSDLDPNPIAAKTLPPPYEPTHTNASDRSIVEGA